MLIKLSRVNKTAITVLMTLSPYILKHTLRIKKQKKTFDKFWLGALEFSTH